MPWWRNAPSVTTHTRTSVSHTLACGAEVKNKAMWGSVVVRRSETVKACSVGANHRRPELNTSLKKAGVKQDGMCDGVCAGLVSQRSPHQAKTFQTHWHRRLGKNSVNFMVEWNVSAPLPVRKMASQLQLEITEAEIDIVAIETNVAVRTLDTLKKS